MRCFNNSAAFAEEILGLKSDIGNLLFEHTAIDLKLLVRPYVIYLT